MEKLMDKAEVRGGGTYEINHNYCDRGIGLDVSNEAIIKPLSCLDNGNWHHVVAITANPSPSLPNPSYANIDFWVDGNLLPPQLCVLGGTTQVLATFFSSIFLGCNVETPAIRYYDGALDDIYFYNRALSSSEVQQLFNDKCALTGLSAFCAGNTYTYSSGISGTSYIWTLPTGWSITGGAGTGSITVSAGNTGGSVQLGVSTGCGTMTRTIAVTPLPNCEHVGIHEIGTEVLLLLHPNPCSDVIKISPLVAFETDQSSMQIINAIGQTVYKGPYSDHLYVGDLGNGLYILKIYNADAVAMARFIKSN